MTVYENNLEYLLDELRRIDILLHLNLEKWKSGSSNQADDFLGLYISEDEVDKILQTPIYLEKKDEQYEAGLEKIETITREIITKKNESIKQSKSLNLYNLARTFDLSPFEENVLLICLAPELDLRYEKLYSYLQNDVTKKYPTIDLSLRLLCSSIEERINARNVFSPDSTLIRNRLIYLSGEDGTKSLLSRHIRMDDKIINFLLGTNEIDRRIRNISKVIKPGKTFDDLILPDEYLGKFKGLIKSYYSGKLQKLYFHGAYGTGKKMMAEAISMELGKLLLLADSKLFPKGEAVETMKILIREAFLQNSLIYIEGFDYLLRDENNQIAAKYIIQELERYPNPVILSGEAPLVQGDALKNHGFLSFGFKIPDFVARKQLWRSFINGNMSEEMDVNALAGKFNFSGGQIKDAISTAINIATAKKKDESKLSMEELLDGCKSQCNMKLVTFARKIETSFAWDDIFLPKDTKEQLREVCGYIKNRGIVISEWGFDRKLALGKGLNVLFSGPSGTGKTMAAGIIASEVGLDIYKIDLSNVVSKYIGETEKNLNRIFKEAETSNSILFFDEADALFGKRSEVKDAHDRYANIEIGYLLQKMEEYEGVVILATNLGKNIDDAFLRRMNFVIEFPFPDETQRKFIWTGIFPKNAPLSNDIDYKFLSEKLKLAGGNIKNIALCAAFYAAEESKEIGMHQIMHSVKREYQKIGKPFFKADFEPYYGLTEG